MKLIVRHNGEENADVEVERSKVNLCPNPASLYDHRISFNAGRNSHMTDPAPLNKFDSIASFWTCGKT